MAFSGLFASGNADGRSRKRDSAMMEAMIGVLSRRQPLRETEA
jgi:hypothetical protein